MSCDIAQDFPDDQVGVDPWLSWYTDAYSRADPPSNGEEHPRCQQFHIGDAGGDDIDPHTDISTPKGPTMSRSSPSPSLAQNITRTNQDVEITFEDQTVTPATETRGTTLECSLVSQYARFGMRPQVYVG